MGPVKTYILRETLEETQISRYTWHAMLGCSCDECKHGWEGTLQVTLKVYFAGDK